MTTDDDMREIEAALNSFASAVFLEVGDGSDDCIERTRMRRDKLLALIRQKLPHTDAEHERAVAAWEAEATRISIHCGGAMQLVQRMRDEALRLMRARPASDKEALQSLRKKVDAMASAEGITLGEWRALDRVLDWIDEESARPAIEPHTFTGLPDTTYEKLVAKEKAAGDLLRAVLKQIRREADNADESYSAGLHRAGDIIEAAERAGVR